MLITACCSVVGIRIKFSVWLVSGYARVFIVISVAVVTLSIETRHLLQILRNKRRHRHANSSPKVARP